MFSVCQGKDCQDDTIGVQCVFWWKAVLCILHVFAACSVWFTYCKVLHFTLYGFSGTFTSIADAAKLLMRHILCQCCVLFGL